MICVARTLVCRGGFSRRLRYFGFESTKLIAGNADKRAATTVSGFWDFFRSLASMRVDASISALPFTSLCATWPGSSAG
jgi:hypothetical protein